MLKTVISSVCSVHKSWISIFLSFLRSFAWTFFNFSYNKAATNKKIKMNFASITHYWVYGWMSAIKICTPAVSIVRLYRFPHTHTRLLCRTRYSLEIYWADVRNYTSHWIMSEMHTRTFTHSREHWLCSETQTKCLNMCHINYVFASKRVSERPIWTPSFAHGFSRLHNLFALCNESTKLSKLFA